MRADEMREKAEYFRNNECERVACGYEGAIRVIEMHLGSYAEAKEAREDG